MTREQAQEKAEYIVYCHCNLGDLIDRCRLAGFNPYYPSGRQKPRHILEDFLIELYTKRNTTE
jgi:hypothetical protein